MARKKVPELTKAERSILGVLWKRGPSTVREIYESLQHKRTSGYTTILKLLTLMIDKGLVARDDSRRSHVYRPLIEEQRVERSVIRDLLGDLFGGSPARLAMCALDEDIPDPRDIELIRKRLEELKRQQE